MQNPTAACPIYYCVTANEEKFKKELKNLIRKFKHLFQLHSFMQLRNFQCTIKFWNILRAT